MWALPLASLAALTPSQPRQVVCIASNRLAATWHLTLGCHTWPSPLAPPRLGLIDCCRHRSGVELPVFWADLQASATRERELHYPFLQTTPGILLNQFFPQTIGFFVKQTVGEPANHSHIAHSSTAVDDGTKQK